jgi:hypothetical protein
MTNGMKIKIVNCTVKYINEYPIKYIKHVLKD